MESCCIFRSNPGLTLTPSRGARIKERTQLGKCLRRGPIRFCLRGAGATQSSSRRGKAGVCRTNKHVKCPPSAALQTGAQNAEKGETASEHPEGSVILLKEWKTTIDALAAGEQIFILRKGGIHERAFTLPSSEFLFIPSFFHAIPEMLKPAFLERHPEALEEPKERQIGEVVEISALARCTALWSSKDPNVLARLNDLHIWTDEFLDKRLAWKADRPLTILELRVSRLLRPVQFQYAKEHGGCKSWVSLPTEALSARPTAGEPALDVKTFSQAQQHLKERLEGSKVEWHSAL